MIPRGNFGHDASVDRMQVYLTVQRMGDQPTFAAEKCYARFIAAGFNAKDIHERRIIPCQSEPCPRSRLTGAAGNLCKAQNLALLYAAQSRPCVGFIYVWTEYLTNAKRSRKRERIF